MIQVKKLFKCQKVVKIKKERETAEVKFSAIKEDVMSACRDLTASEFALYMYLISNQHGYTFGLSKEDVIEQTGISARSYTSAVQSLITKGYLIYTHEQATDGKEIAPLYNFISRPDAKFA